MTIIKKWVMALLPGHIQYSPVFVWLFSFLVFLLTSGKCRRNVAVFLHTIVSLWKVIASHVFPENKRVFVYFLTATEKVGWGRVK